MIEPPEELFEHIERHFDRIYESARTLDSLAATARAMLAEPLEADEPAIVHLSAAEE